MEDLSQDIDYLRRICWPPYGVPGSASKYLDMDLSWDGPKLTAASRAGLSASVRAAPSGPLTAAGDSLPGPSDYPDSRERFAVRALRHAGADRPTDLVDVAKLWAGMFTEGFYGLGIVAAALIELDLSRSTMENLPGYLGPEG